MRLVKAAFWWARYLTRGDESWVQLLIGVNLTTSRVVVGNPAEPSEKLVRWGAVERAGERKEKMISRMERSERSSRLPVHGATRYAYD